MISRTSSPVSASCELFLLSFPPSLILFKFKLFILHVMADPLTALGAAAAASQFVSQALSITIYVYQAFSNIKAAPEFVRKAFSEVEQLISISKLVIQNSSLQVDSIAAILGSCLGDIKILNDILRKISPGSDAGQLEKLRKAFMAVLKREDVMMLLRRLDREKMNLALCMHEINSYVKLMASLQVVSNANQ
jgi:hypothetical protein